MPDDEGHVPANQAMDMNRVMAEFYEEMLEASSQIQSVCDPDVGSALVSMHRALHKLADAVTGCPAGVRVADNAVFDTPTDKIEPHYAPHYAPHDASRKAY